MKNPDQLLTTRQVSDEYGIAVPTLRYYRQCGTGPASFNLGKRKVVYRRSEVDRWISAQEAASTRGGVSA